jgi:hypothetical protein
MRRLSPAGDSLSLDAEITRFDETLGQTRPIAQCEMWNDCVDVDPGRSSIAPGWSGFAKGQAGRPAAAGSETRPPWRWKRPSRLPFSDLA